MFASSEFPELEVLIKRKFNTPGDVDQAVQCVQRSSGLTRTRQLAIAHAEAAARQILKLAPSKERDSLVELARIIVTRKF